MPERLIRKARNLWRQPFFVWAWLIPVWSLLGVARLLILAVTFKRLYPCFGDRAGIEPLRPLIDPWQVSRAVQIGRVIRMAARYTPWNSNCFPQAIVARVLLGLYRIPYAMYLGLMRDPSGPGLQAHAWVAAGRIDVTGGASFSRFTVVAMFLSPLLRRG
jgi:hypothetical protein